MNTALLLGLAIGVSAPAPKDPPPKTGSIVGEWVIESVTIDGEPATSRAGVRCEFTRDGRRFFASERGSKLQEHCYKVDPRADPPTIDIVSRSGSPLALGIYKVESERLVISFSFEANMRPTAFDSSEGSHVTFTVLKRVNKKE